MVRYLYSAVDARGQTVEGALEANSARRAIERLRDSGLWTRSVREEGRWSHWRERWSPPRRIDIEFALRQLAFLSRSGVPILQALRSTAAETSRRSLRTQLERVAGRVESGESLSRALEAQRGFPPVVVRLVEVGESSGELDVCLRRAAEGLERERILRSTVLGALLYPAVVLALALGTVAYMMVSLVPKLTRFLEQLRRPMPAPTRLLIDISHWVELHALTTGILVSLFVLALVLYRATAAGRLQTDRWLLRMPIFGSILMLASTTSFARYLGLLLKSGVRVPQALETVAPLLRNRHLATHVLEARARVVHGAELAPQLQRPGGFPALVGGMVAIGERSGSLDEVLSELGEYHDARLSETVRRVLTFLEPALIVFVGSLVGFVYLSFFLAVYSVAPGR
jgi:type II secretory pathway component PulF